MIKMYLKILNVFIRPNEFLRDSRRQKIFHCFSEKIGLDISCESSARQRIHTKHQALFSSKDRSKSVVCCNYYLAL